jgi:phage gp29-like protein
MAGKTLTLSAPPELLQELCSVLRLYADAAWPPGGSECGQAARETLLNAVQGIEASIAADMPASMSRRLRATVRAASDYYVEALATRGEQFAARAALLEEMLTGQAVGLSAYLAAVSEDAKSTS